MPTRAKCGDSAHVEGFQCTVKNSSVKLATSLNILPAFVTRKRKLLSNQGNQKAHQLQAAAVYAKDNAICGQSEDDSSSEGSFCLQVKVKCTQAYLQRIPRPTHLITNLAYKLKTYHTRNMYLRARLDTCVDVNIMPASVYRLVFQDSNMKKLAPSSLEIGTYTADTVKIIGSCMFYLVHPDTKKLMDVTFFDAMNDGSVLLSCKTTLMIGLIQPRTRLDYHLELAW